MDLKQTLRDLTNDFLARACEAESERMPAIIDALKTAAGKGASGCAFPYLSIYELNSLDAQGLTTKISILDDITFYLVSWS